MNTSTKTALSFAMAAMFIMWPVDASRIPGLGVGKAEARVGRPLTPISYAGVARRTTRRAVGAAVAAGTYYHYVPGCAKRVDAYGRVYYVCP